jgi:winged helix-turn-helix protein
MATVSWEALGVSYHKAQTLRPLKRLRWTPQLPIERAAQRDEAVIKQWRIQVWPELKRDTHRRTGHCLCERVGLLSPAGDGPNVRAMRTDTGAAVAIYLRSCGGDEGDQGGRTPLHAGA